MTITLKIKDEAGGVLATVSGNTGVGLCYQKAFEPGDQIVLTTSKKGEFLVVSFDSTLPPTLIYLAEDEFHYPIPFGKLSEAHAPAAFQGEKHRIMVRQACGEELSMRRNLALNPHDMPSIEGVFPHATANVETRNEAVFFARNAIDGETLNSDHGKWPFSSWGINCNPNAAITVRFGKPVKTDKAVITLRADFPHDAWWSSAQLCFSNGFETQLALIKSAEEQVFSFPEQTVEWVRLEKLVKADDPSLYPALTQIQIWGTHF
ncbi:MAG: carbohydrate-binding protein [Roseibium sp.]